MARRSPRSTTHLVHHLEASDIFKDFVGLKLDGVAPLSEYLWEQTTEYHNEALNSKYVQGLKNAALNPERFGAYMVQDSAFCYKAKVNIDTAASRATDVNVKTFLEKRSESYTKYYEELFATWHIEDATGIKLGDKCADYVNHEKNVAQTLDAVYFVVAMIPCAKLWPWIGQQIKAEQGNFGVYTDWVKTNFYPDSSGVIKYEKLINAAEAAGKIDRNKALEVYLGSMKGEAGFFSSI